MLQMYISLWTAKPSWLGIVCPWQLCSQFCTKHEFDNGTDLNVYNVVVMKLRFMSYIYNVSERKYK